MTVQSISGVMPLAERKKLFLAKARSILPSLRRCCATSKSTGNPCLSVVVTGATRCRMHGGMIGRKKKPRRGPPSEAAQLRKMRNTAIRDRRLELRRAFEDARARSEAVPYAVWRDLTGSVVRWEELTDDQRALLAVRWNDGKALPEPFRKEAWHEALAMVGRPVPGSAMAARWARIPKIEEMRW